MSLAFEFMKCNFFFSNKTFAIRLKETKHHTKTNIFGVLVLCHCNCMIEIKQSVRFENGNVNRKKYPLESHNKKKHTQILLDDDFSESEIDLQQNATWYTIDKIE